MFVEAIKSVELRWRGRLYFLFVNGLLALTTEDQELAQRVSDSFLGGMRGKLDVTNSVKVVVDESY